jgi:hypothetical protein
MRKLVLAAVGAATIAMAGPLATRSEAMPIDPGLRPAVAAVNPVQKTYWRRWGWGPRYYWRPHYWYWGPRHYWRPHVWHWRWWGWHHRRWWR